MGTDIHAFIEFQLYPDGGSWSFFGSVQPGRDYRLFNAIAFGVDGAIDAKAYPIRGLPEGLSLKVWEEFYQPADKVIAHFEEIDRLCGDEPDFDPAGYAVHGGPSAVEKFQNEGVLPNPAFYYYNWLNLNELKAALRYAKLEVADCGVECRAILLAMETLASECGPENVRLVFAFDG